LRALDDESIETHARCGVQQYDVARGGVAACVAAALLLVTYRPCCCCSSAVLPANFFSILLQLFCVVAGSAGCTRGEPGWKAKQPRIENYGNYVSGKLSLRFQYAFISSLKLTVHSSSALRMHVQGYNLTHPSRNPRDIPIPPHIYKSADPLQPNNFVALKVSAVYLQYLLS
jgi:hypothetical protein